MGKVCPSIAPMTFERIKLLRLNFLKMKGTNLVMSRLKHLCLGWQVPGIYSSGWTQLTMEELSPGRKSKQHHFIIILRITIPSSAIFLFLMNWGKMKCLTAFGKFFHSLMYFLSKTLFIYQKWGYMIIELIFYFCPIIL